MARTNPFEALFADTRARMQAERLASVSTNLASSGEANQKVRLQQELRRQQNRTVQLARVATAGLVDADTRGPNVLVYAGNPLEQGRTLSAARKGPQKLPGRALDRLSASHQEAMDRGPSLIGWSVQEEQRQKLIPLKPSEIVSSGTHAWNLRAVLTPDVPSGIAVIADSNRPDDPTAPLMIDNPEPTKLLTWLGVHDYLAQPGALTAELPTDTLISREEARQQAIARIIIEHGFPMPGVTPPPPSSP